MNTKDLSFTFTTTKPIAEVFHDILNVRGWWSEELEGRTEKVNDEFTYQYKDMHTSKQRMIELVPNRKVTWLVTNSSLNFIKNKGEWTGTKFGFEIEEKEKKTRVKFIHYGLVPKCECYEACNEGWSYYIKDSLKSLIEEGVGKPNWGE